MGDERQHNETLAVGVISCLPRTCWGSLSSTSHVWRKALAQMLICGKEPEQLMGFLWKEPWLRCTAEGVCAVLCRKPNITGKEARDLLECWKVFDPEWSGPSIVRVYRLLRRYEKEELGLGYV